MRWIDEMLLRAERSCPKGGQEPFVIYPWGPDDWLSEENMREQLQQMAHRERKAVESAFEQWATTGRWPRSTRCSGWLIREILAQARNEGAALSNSLARRAAHGGSDQTAAVLADLCGLWFECGLPVWVAAAAQDEFEVQRIHNL